MALDILCIVLGIVMILKGADTMVDGATGLARRLRVGEVVIGLTVVAFGTSLPEFVVSMFSALKGSADMSAGNVVGSNIFNTLAILGVTAIVTTVPVGRRALFVDIPLSLFSALIFILLCFDMYLWGWDVNQLSRLDGALLLLLFAIFMGYSFWLSRRKVEVDSFVEDKQGYALILLKIVLGIALLVLGGNILVDSAASVAREFGVSEAVIGLTLLAAGTSLPELATSAVAARKGSVGMAVGNVIGSNVFNVFLVLGAASLIRPMQIEGIRGLDVAFLLGSSLAVMLLAIAFRRLNRWMGILLVVAYAVYLALLIAAS